jgi:hypothetical protein
MTARWTSSAAGWILIFMNPAITSPSKGGETPALQLRIGVDQLLEGVLLLVELADLVNDLHGVEQVCPPSRPRW